MCFWKSSMLMRCLFNPELTFLSWSSLRLFTSILVSFNTPKTFWILWFDLITKLPFLLWVSGEAPNTLLALSWVSAVVISQVISWILWWFKLVLVWGVHFPVLASCTTHSECLGTSVIYIFIFTFWKIFKSFWRCFSFNYWVTELKSGLWISSIAPNSFLTIWVSAIVIN